MTKQTVNHIVLSLCALILANSASAATIAWTNTAGGNWSVANNWNPHQVPGSSDDVLITAPGVYTVTLDASPTIATLALGAASGQQTLLTGAFTLTVKHVGAVNASGIFNLNGGTTAATGLNGPRTMNPPGG